DVAHPGLARRAGVARGNQHLADARLAGALPGERVLAASAADDQDLHQWRKWRMAVNTIAMPCSSAAAITSASRLLPPGWMTARMPKPAATSTLSRKGRNASDAITAPASAMFSSLAFMAATRVE